MIIKQFVDVDNKKIELDGALGVRKRVLVGEGDGAPNFIMRMFSVKPGGYTPFHTHDWEHEIYVLSGTGYVKKTEGNSKISAGSVVLVLPNEEHGFVNTGKDVLTFLCIIPK